MLNIYENRSLKGMNTFGFDVECSRLVEFDDVSDLRQFFAENSIPEKWSVIGAGSNILFTGDYDGTLFHPTDTRVTTTSEDAAAVTLRAGAGLEWDRFVGYCVDRGYWGAENLSYIPGTVGASPVQNIGAYGVEAKDIIESVECYCVDKGTTLTLAREHCDFGYRSSIFKGFLRGRVIITAVNFVLGKVPNPKMGYGQVNDRVTELGGPTLKNIREAVTAIRKEKLPEPSEIGNAGSFFKNPVVADSLARGLKDLNPEMPLYPSGQEGLSKLAAGWLIDRSGWRGLRDGNVGVHRDQALVLVHYGGGDGRQVLDLAAKIQADIMEKYGVAIETEVNIL